MPYLLIGAGGLAAELCQHISRDDLHVAGALDDTKPVGIASNGVRVLGPISDIGKYPDYLVLLAIGNPYARRKVRRAIRKRYISGYLSKFALVGHDVSVGLGAIIAPFNMVAANAEVGDFLFMNFRSSISHDCVLGDYVTVGPHTMICGKVRVGDCTELGAGVTVIPGVSIGSNCIIGAGATVVDDIPDNSLAVGVPARVIRCLPSQS